MNSGGWYFFFHAVQISIQKHTLRKQRPTRSATGYSGFLVALDLNTGLRPRTSPSEANGDKTASTVAEIAAESACEMALPSFFMTVEEPPFPSTAVMHAYKEQMPELFKL